MEFRDFCYWLQGYFEVSGNRELTKEQVDIIQKHLALLFDNRTSNCTRSVSFNPSVTC